MKSLQYVCYLCVSVVLVSGKNCDENGILIYEDLGCTAEYGEDKQCPVKYSCKGLEPSDTNCYFRGRSYDDGETVNRNLSSPSCDVGCFCRTSEGRSSFTCAILDCAEWLGKPVDEGCYRKYSLDSCCSVGKICPPFTSNEKCVVEGKEYQEGQEFYPSNTCLKCVCQKGFSGKLEEPFCRRMLCGQQLKRPSSSITGSCGAFYRKDKQVLCCPDDWICPDGSEKIEGTPKSEEICKFGSKNVKLGQYFHRNDVKDNFGRSFPKIKCECVIPPLMKCTDVQ